jgi:hypothetical protein
MCGAGRLIGQSWCHAASRPAALVALPDHQLVRSRGQTAMSVFSCKDTVRLVSYSLDQRLRIGQRASVSVHLAMCPMCSRFKRQLRFLRDAAKKYEEAIQHQSQGDFATLSSEARARLKQILESESR